MSLDHILLGMLRDPATGYDLGKEFNEGARHYWHAERSQIYPALGKLEARGWLRCWTEPSERGPERKVYETTPEGRDELRRWLRAGPRIGPNRLAYIAQTFFLGELEDLDESIRLVEAMAARWREAMAPLEAAEREVMAACGDPEDLPDRSLHHYAALRMGLYQYRAKLAWCDETLARLNRRRAAARPPRSPRPPRWSPRARNDRHGHAHR